MRTLNKNIPAHFLLDSFFNGHRPNVKKHHSPVVNKRILHNVIKTDNGFTIEFAVPGFEKENFSVKIEEGQLIVNGEKSNNSEMKYTHKEFDFTSFEKKFSIPKDVDSTKISANYTNGILKVNLELKEKVTKQINIH